MKKQLFDYFEDFMNTAASVEEAAKSSDAKIHNKQYEIKRRIFEVAKQEIGSAPVFYQRLMKEGSVSVKISAATHLLALNLNVKEAEETLSSLAQNERLGFFSFIAATTLREWKKKGYLKI